MVCETIKPILTMFYIRQGKISAREYIVRTPIIMCISIRMGVRPSVCVGVGEDITKGADLSCITQAFDTADCVREICGPFSEGDRPNAREPDGIGEIAPPVLIVSRTAESRHLLVEAAF